MITMPLDNRTLDNRTLDNRTWRHDAARDSTATMLQVAALSIAVLVGLAILSPLIRMDGTSASPQDVRSTIAQCGTVAEGALRLACYDKVAGRALPQPAKGANAPLFNPSFR